MELVTSPYTNPETPTGGIQKLGDYHPWHGGNNPNFDVTSSDILKFKKADPQIIGQYYYRINPLLRVDMDIAITWVPGHDPAKISPGLSTLATLLSNQGRTLANKALIRTRKIEKLSGGGDRSKNIHRSSIDVDRSQVEGKIVLLLDDVMTTGNSINVCIEKILGCNPKSVSALILGQTVSG